LSSILEALKKAESESAQRDQVQIRSGKLTLADGQRPRRRLGLKWAFVAGGIMTAAAIVVWFFKPEATVGTSATIQSYRITPPKKKTAQKAPTQIQPKTPSKDKRRATVDRPPVKATTRTSGSGLPRPVQKEDPPGGKRSKVPPTRQGPEQKTADRPEPQSQARDYQRSGHGLTLQAIAWDPDAKKRFAVINNQIIRQGQSVGNKVVEHISEDEIIVARGSERWKIEFRIE